MQRRRLSFHVKSIVGLVLCGTGVFSVFLSFCAWSLFSPSFTESDYTRLFLTGSLLLSIGVTAILVGWWVLRANKKEKTKGLS